MKYSISIVALAAIIGSATAVSIADIPSCAQTCILNAISKATKCAVTDNACQCEAENQSAITTEATPCVLGACSASDAAKTIQVTGEICAALSSASSAAPATSSAAASTSVDSTTVETTTVPSSTVEVSTSAVPETTSAAPETTSAVPETTITSTPVATTAVGTLPGLVSSASPSSTVTVVSGVASVTGTTGVSPTTSAAPFTGAANQAAATMGSVFAVALGVAALL